MKKSSPMFALIRERGANLIDDLTTGLVNNMRFSDHNVLYPPESELQPGQGVEAEWFYDSYKGSTGHSELDTIHMYITQEVMFEEIGEMMMGIAMVEMKHLDKLGDLISGLGGTVAQRNDTDRVRYGATAAEAVELAIAGERAAVKDYEALTARVAALPSNPTTAYTLALLAKLTADELLHISLFEQWRKENG
jgi:bacterioferritin (cytochrome b1)